jgi:hypothetical protein
MLISDIQGVLTHVLVLFCIVISARLHNYHLGVHGPEKETPWLVAGAKEDQIKEGIRGGEGR